jgi:hypothetical protein
MRSDTGLKPGWKEWPLVEYIRRMCHKVMKINLLDAETVDIDKTRAIGHGCGVGEALDHLQGIKRNTKALE